MFRNRRVHARLYIEFMEVGEDVVIKTEWFLGFVLWTMGGH